MGIWQMQSSLNRGELDEKLVGRIDLNQYYQGLSEATNVVCLPQGGVTRRPGTEYIGTAYGSARLENFSFNVEQNYLLVFTSGRMQVYKDGTLQTNINGSGLDYLVVPWSVAQVDEFDYIQSADTIIITHPDVEPYKITRTSDTTWTLTAALATEDIPFYDYDDTSSPTPTDEKQTLTFTNVTNGDRFKISFDGFLSDEIVHDTSDAGVSTASDIEKELNNLPNIRKNTVTVTAVSALVFDIVFGGDSANEWELVKVTPVYVKNATTWTAAGSQTEAGVSRKERVWSATRGWPKTCTFHEGRLWFGGSSQLPQTLWGSYVNDFFNFLPDKGFDDEPIAATLDTDQVNAIESIFSNRSLQIFTAGAEFYVPQSPITPENIAVQRQTNIGSRRVRPVTIDGVTIFAQRAGTAIYEFVYLDEMKANTSTSASILSPHLIFSPVKMAVQRGAFPNDGNYVYILNLDGTMAVYNTLSSEEVAGFTRWETDGSIGSIAVVGNYLYLSVRREVDATIYYHLEAQSLISNTDASKLYLGSGLTTLTGLDHLEGETVKIKADGAMREDQVVASGEVTLDPASDGPVEVGLGYDLTVTTMPLNINLQGGPIASQKKRILRASIQLYESVGVVVNGQRIEDKTIGLNQFDPPEPFTGLKRIFLSGWSLDARITITQTTPYDLTILNIGNEVKT